MKTNLPMTLSVYKSPVYPGKETHHYQLKGTWPPGMGRQRGLVQQGTAGPLFRLSLLPFVPGGKRGGRRKEKGEEDRKRRGRARREAGGDRHRAGEGRGGAQLAGGCALWMKDFFLTAPSFKDGPSCLLSPTFPVSHPSLGWD